MVAVVRVVAKFNWLSRWDWNRAVPFGDGVAALVTTLRYSHAISYARLSQLMSEVFQLSISEGALANLLEVKTQLAQRLRQFCNAYAVRGWWAVMKPVRGLRARRCGNVFQNAQICLHVIRPSRGAAVIEQVMEGHRPEILGVNALRRSILRTIGKFA